MHPHYQHPGGQYICQKRRRAYVIVSCHQEVIWKMALVAGSSQHLGGNERMTTRSDVT